MSLKFQFRGEIIIGFFSSQVKSVNFSTLYHLILIQIKCKKNTGEKNIIATLTYFFLNLQNPSIYINRSEQISICISRFPYINRPVNQWNQKLVYLVRLLPTSAIHDFSSLCTP